MAAPEFHLFLPQMRMTFDALVVRATIAEAAGFSGIWGMDHLIPPFAHDQPMYEAITTTTWLAARTERLVVGNLVLCDAFRYPAVLARQAVTIDHASGGRFELGIGSGSLPVELDVFGLGPERARDRTHRLRETLDVLAGLWSGTPFDYDGRYFRIRGGRQMPLPSRKIPIVIGGTGPATMELVARHADWWNVPVHKLHRLDEMRPHAGSARVSIQNIVGLVGSESERDEVRTLAKRRFPGYGAGLRVGDAAELVDYYSELCERGIERFYVWFSDFAPPPTLEAFAVSVIGKLVRA
jgi:alkanesulfonate monooxygenase SsuD/methylene tetrahydromethanopterin reductase-like flavin-dependent oxidoreductase (luciferase family)